jgi:hypothetical protein
MCGDLDHSEDTATLAAYRQLKARVSRAQAARNPQSPDLAAYMSDLFNDVLSRACADAEAASSVDRDLLLAQSVVLARAAGVLAAQLPATEDPLRNVIEAVMDGYAGGQGGPTKAGLDHDHDHHDHHHHHAHT